MAIQPGTRLGPYEVGALIGAGGMGEVYKARDTRLQRDVALKVLPEAFVHDTQRMARFEREARLLASLNHPNIAAIHGLEESGPVRALVMEFVEGPTLADRIRSGPIPVDEALPIARQVADAVEYAHDKNVIHRDLKPANIKVKEDGTVKVLDFGLAKAMSEDPHEGDMANSPTLSMAATRQGVILGTAAYMSPEQAKGKAVDRRADVWAFGVVLYEMLTGKQPFSGETVPETMASVMKEAPSLDVLPATAPTSIRNLLRRCLEKDPRRRLVHIGEARILLEDLLSGAARADPVSAATVAAPRLPLWRRSMPVAIAAVLAAALSGMAGWILKPAPSGPVRRFNYVLPEGQAFRGTGERVLAISPDGRQFVYNASGGLYLRRMDETESRHIPGTEGNLDSPFFSPDGQSIGYFEGGQLKRISVTGGAPVTICETPWQSREASWGRDGTIVYGQRDGIWQVPAEGGEPLRVVQAMEGEDLRNPQVLPGGEWILLTASSGGNDGDIVLYSRRTGERRVLLRGGADARYVPTGYLAYVFEDVLFVTAFDLKSLELRGQRVPMIQRVDRALFTGAGDYAFADDGSLVYLSGQMTAAKNLVWVNRDGGTERFGAIRAGNYDAPRLSPDGMRILVWANGDAWIYELATGRANRLTSDGSGDRYGEWSPSGSQVAYSSSRLGDMDAWVESTDGSQEPRQLTDLGNVVHVDSWSPDGQTLAVHYHAPDGGSNLLMIPMDKPEAAPKEFLLGESAEAGTVFSPDGRYVAYYSEESGQGEVYIRPYPGPGGRNVVSVGGGREPVWAANGELFYRNLAGDRMLTVSVATAPTLRIGAPRAVFQGRYYVSPSRRPQYDVTADGQRFVMLGADTSDSSAALPRINVVLNWFEELKQRVPTGN